MVPTIDFWFSIGSTYTYLSVSRLAQVQKERNVQFRWRPFDLRTITREMNNRPFADKPVKLAYMWRDLERRCALYGIQFNGKPPYSINDLPRPNRVALIGVREGWCEAYAGMAYRHWFMEHEDPSEDPNISRSLEAIGRDAGSLMTLADSAETQQALDAETRQAKALGIFGSPTFVVGHEVFWGDDRLDDAVQWALSPPALLRPDASGTGDEPAD